MAHLNGIGSNEKSCCNRLQGGRFCLADNGGRGGGSGVTLTPLFGGRLQQFFGLQQNRIDCCARPFGDRRHIVIAECNVTAANAHQFAALQKMENQKINCARERSEL